MPEKHLQLADVFRAGFEQYCRQYGPLPAQHYRVAHALMNCHTARLGGHVWRCEHCGAQRITYNSCRNRHCPSCQARQRAQWVDARTRELLPVRYFHVVFTLPAQLNPFALRNKTAFYNMLFAASSQTLLELGRDEKRLGAELGFVTILHTWGQNLMDHPHLHCIVPGGGLDDDRWVAGRSQDFLLPVKVLAALFRGKFMALLQEALRDGSIALHGSLACLLEQPQMLRRLVDSLYRMDWVVYAKPPFGGPAAVVKYLGRYTHRIAIANSRILSLTATHVSFAYKDYAAQGRAKVLTLTIVEFIRRFLMHVVPRGFVRIRYYGFMANRHRVRNIEECRRLLGQGRDASVDRRPTADRATPVAPVTKDNADLCPRCQQGRMHMVGLLERQRTPPDPTQVRAALVYRDTS
jgi:hypothetical protein